MQTSRPRARKYLTPTHHAYSFIPLFLILILSMFCFSSFFLFQQVSSTPFHHTLHLLTQQPFDSRLHLQLTQMYYELGNLPEAEKELTLSQDSPLLFGSPLQGKVLGNTSEMTDLAHKLKTEPEMKNKKRVYWEKVVQDHPEYRDGWVQLLYLSINEGDVVNSQIYTEEINKLDPNFIMDLPTFEHL